MKKILGLVLAVCFVVVLMSFVAVAETPDRIEISFRVGDSILNINGEPVEVETPFVAGDGVTLVPLRVISEAFGAEVEWVGETRHIIITYRNVEITLQIENINAYVNEQRQTLLFAPQLRNNVTMVPLRFISENFGADVGWDADTRAITVVKDITDDTPADIEDILRRSNLPMAGDSFLGWSIRRTPDMELSFRRFDGRCNIFYLAGGDVIIDIDHFNNTDNETFAAIQATEMALARNYTLIGQNVRRTASGAEFVATQFRDRFDFVERRVFVRPNGQIVLITTVIDNSISASERDEFLTVVDTFDFVFREHETEDLSDVVNGMRLFDNRDLRVQFRLPAEWLEVHIPDRDNYFMFGNLYDEGVLAGASFEVVSIQGGDSAERWARETLESETRLYNPNTHTFSQLGTMRVGGSTATYFQKEGRLVDFEFISRSIFWEHEGYMYNLYITVQRRNDAMLQMIVDSVRFEAIDPNVVGAVIRAPIETGNAVFSSVRNTSLGFTMDVPATWLRRDNNSMFLDDRINLGVAVVELDSSVNIQDAREISENIARSPDVTLVRAVAELSRAELSSNALSGFMFEIRRQDAAGTTYAMYYVINSGNRAYLILATMSEHLNSEANRGTIARMVRSFVVN